MPICRNDYAGVVLTNQTYWNWSRTFSYNIDKLYQPTTLRELVDVVAKASEAGEELHALGSGWSFEPITASADRVVSLEHLNKIRRGIVPNALTDQWVARTSGQASVERLVCVEAGITLGDLNEALQTETEPLAMLTLGGRNGQTLAGAISTSTHGGDLGQPPLPDVVMAIHLVAHGGDEWWIERASTPPLTDDVRLRSVLGCKHVTILRDDSTLNAAVVAIGRFGVVYSYVLRVRPLFRLNEWVQRRLRVSVLASLRAGVDANSGLDPLHDNLVTGTVIPAGLARSTTVHPSAHAALNRADVIPAGLGQDPTVSPHFTQIIFNSQDPELAWVQRRWETSNPVDLHADAGGRVFLCDMTQARGLLALAAQALNAELAIQVGIPIYGALMSSIITSHSARLVLAATNPWLTSAEVLSLVLTALWDCGLGTLVPRFCDIALDTQFTDGMKEGRCGPGHVITSGTREASLEKCYTGESIEVIFPATTFAYIDFLTIVLSASPSFHQAGWVSARFSQPSHALLSMHNLASPTVVSIEFASCSGLDGNGAWLQFIESVGLSLGGRPHWGQFNRLDEGHVARLYGANLVEWKEALLSVSGTSTTFSNACTRRYGLEPAGIVREITATRKTSHGVITHLCGAPTSRWGPLPADAAVAQIESGSIKYFTRSGASVSPVAVVDGPHGKYLRSHADSTASDNLDALPDC